MSEPSDRACSQTFYSNVRGSRADVSVARTFLRSKAGRAALYVAALGERRGPADVVVCPPLAEEQGFARGPLFRVAARLAEAGRRAVVYDPRGHGDSEGDFADVSLDDLVGDLERVARQACPPRVDGAIELLVGVRLGALVAARAAAAGLVRPRGLVLVAPALDGRAFARQLLRKHVAAELAQTGKVQRDADALRQALSRGEPLDVDGWPLSPALFSDLEAEVGAALLARGAAAKASLDVVLVGRGAGLGRSPELEALLRARPDARVHAVVSGEFWREERLQVIHDAPELAEILEALLAASPEHAPSSRHVGEHEAPRV